METANIKPNRGISASALLEHILEIIYETKSCQKVIFTKKVIALISRDSNPHAPLPDYMVYKAALICPLNDKLWTVISLGKYSGDDPASQYDSDILSIEISPVKAKDNEELSEEIQKAIEKCENFHNSMVIARKSGELIVPNDLGNPFRSKMLEILRETTPIFALQDLTSFSSDPKQFKLPPIQYERVLARILATKIWKVLSR